MSVFEAVKCNLAVRRFDDRPVSTNDILRILEAGRLCQRGKNLQPWHFIVIRDKTILNALEEMIKGDLDEPIMKRAPLAFALLSDSASEFDKVDIGRVGQNMTWVAWELGIGSCFMSGPEAAERVVSQGSTRLPEDSIEPLLGRLLDFWVFEAWATGETEESQGSE